MSAVVQQAAQADGLGQVVNGIKLAEAKVCLVAELAFPQVGVDHRAEHPRAHVHHANTVKEA